MRVQETGVPVPKETAESQMTRRVEGILRLFIAETRFISDHQKVQAPAALLSRLENEGVRFKKTSLDSRDSGISLTFERLRSGIYLKSITLEGEFNSLSLKIRVLPDPDAGEFR